MGKEKAPQPKVVETVSSLYTSVEIEDMETMAPLLAQLPDAHTVSLFASYNNQAHAPISALSLDCTPETRTTPFYLRSRIAFEVAPEDRWDEWMQNLRLTLKEMIDIHTDIDPNIIFDPLGDDDEFFIAVARNLVAKISFDTGERQYGLTIETLTSHEFLEYEMNVSDNTSDTPASPKERYDALRRFATIWAFAQDAIRQDFAETDASQARHVRLAAPSRQLYMPGSELYDEDNLTFDDVAGYDEVKQQLLDLALVARYPEEAAAIGLDRTHGILLHGEPGTGKTTLLRALAGEIDAQLVELSVSDIIDKWVGASARNIDEFFDELLEEDELTVLLMDEFDALAVAKGHASSSERTDVIDRLKVLIDDTVRSHPNILLVGATNNLERVDPTLVRPERFTPIEVLPPNEQGRREIISFMLGRVGLQAFATEQQNDKLPRLTMSDDVDVYELAAKSRGLVAANFSAALDAIRRERLREYITTSHMQPIHQVDLLTRLEAYRMNRE